MVNLEGFLNGKFCLFEIVKHRNRGRTEKKIIRLVPQNFREFHLLFKSRRTQYDQRL